MQKRIDALLDITGISLPLVGVYDVDDETPFQPFNKPSKCIFSGFGGWLNGYSTIINSRNASAFGCSGAGYWFCGIESVTKEEIAGFLAGQEGLKASTDLMCQWLETHPAYRMEHTNIVISRLRDDQYEFLKTVTFFVNPDQLSLLLTGAEYRSASPDSGIVMAPYGSGCGLMLSLFRNFDEPWAVIGATDIAMRKFLDPDTLAFTVTKPLFEQLCGLDDTSFLHKTFWKDVRETREAQVRT
jgi:hypothetical protein